MIINQIITVQNLDDVAQQFAEMGAYYRHYITKEGEKACMVSFSEKGNVNFIFIEQLTHKPYTKWNMSPKLVGYEFLCSDAQSYKRQFGILNHLFKEMPFERNNFEADSYLDFQDPDLNQIHLCKAESFTPQISDIPWISRPDSLEKVAAFDICFRIFVRDIRESAKFYTAYGFSPFLFDKKSNVKVLELKHKDVDGFRLVLVGYEKHCTNSYVDVKYDDINFQMRPHSEKDFGNIKKHLEQKGNIQFSKLFRGLGKLTIEPVGHGICGTIKMNS